MSFAVFRDGVIFVHSDIGGVAEAGAPLSITLSTGDDCLCFFCCLTQEACESDNDIKGAFLYDNSSF